MIHETESFLANNFDAHSPGCFFDGVVVWFAVWQKATKVMDLRCLFSVVLGNIALSYPHFVCSVIDMICSIYIADPALPEDNVETFHVVHCEPPHICVAVVP